MLPSLPSRYRFPISSILPPRLFSSLSPLCVRVCVCACACIERTRIPRRLFLSTRMPFYDVPSLGHDLFLFFSSSPGGELRVRPPTRDKISRITRSVGNYPMGGWRKDRFFLYSRVSSRFFLPFEGERVIGVARRGINRGITKFTKNLPFFLYREKEDTPRENLSSEKSISMRYRCYIIGAPFRRDYSMDSRKMEHRNSANPRINPPPPLEEIFTGISGTILKEKLDRGGIGQVGDRSGRGINAILSVRPFR